MRQRRWMELFSDYGCETKYHIGKANIVVDACRRKGGVNPRRVREDVSGDVRTLIMEEAYATKYFVHLRDKIGESKMIGLEMEQEMTKVVVIKERLKEAKDPQERVKLIVENQTFRI
uniref:Putative reverse transcriptase domain-containing protein n=1 Tax=Tanacetum cinerariifolium TaxID=118510 RepID=A0A6L2NMN6_TANCI|nr:putative reverse transcriptase domain-containing protein [Tanacetum cinerariifolium]GEU87360.1 putative reverse transcriptase domain-containing protein [Tanacetum cinerariifolium]